MVSDVISLVGKNPQVPRFIVLGVPVLMVDDMAWFDLKILRNNGPPDALAVPVPVIFSLLFAFKVSVVALLRAEQMPPVTDLTPGPRRGLTAGRAGYRQHAIFSGVDTRSFNHLVYALSGLIIPLGDLYHRLKANGVCVDNVNLLFWRESCRHDSTSNRVNNGW